MVDPNTRQGKRTPVTLKIKFKSETLEQFIERYAVDVSQGGIFIRTKEPLSVGTQMKFEFQLRDASPLIAGEGTVVWTRENDPSRPAIAPGMGVRFDRLADGSQGILERILTEKVKQAPQRPQSDTAKPPMFTDTPTRVAPAPVQEALLGKDGRTKRASDEPASDSHTPLPKPMPFHTDADEFPDEAFEEATKVRALDELIAQTAEGNGPADRAADRKFAESRAETVDGAHEAETVMKPVSAADLADISPEPPRSPKLLDTSPSPRTEAAQPAFVSESMARTRLGVEPARPGRISTPPAGHPVAEGPSMGGVRAVAAEQTEPARMPPVAPSRSIAPIAILILLLLAAGGAAVWFFIIRPKATETATTAPPATGSATAGSDVGSAAAGSDTGSAVAAAGSDAAGAAAAGSAAEKADLVDTVISASADGAAIEVVGTDQKGPSPLTAKLEKGKAYKARISARGYAANEVDVKGGEKQVAKLVLKPRVISVTSDPPGALLSVDNATTGHSTPYDIELTAAQAAKKTVRVQIRKSGFKTLERVVDLSKMTEDDVKMTTKLDEKLAVQVAPPPRPVNPGAGKGSQTGAGSDSTPTATPPENSGGEHPTEPAPAPTPPPAEPEPKFNEGQTPP